MGQRPFWKTTNPPAIRKIPRILWKDYVHYCDHKSTRVVQLSLFGGRWCSPRLSILFMVYFHIILRPGSGICSNHARVICCSHLAPQFHYLCEGHNKPLTYCICNQLIPLGAVCWCVLGFRTISPSSRVCSKSSYVDCLRTFCTSALANACDRNHVLQRPCSVCSSVHWAWPRRCSVCCTNTLIFALPWLYGPSKSQTTGAECIPIPSVSCGNTWLSHNFSAP